jgi:ABC-type sugar transport system permease subunit
MNINQKRKWTAKRKKQLLFYLAIIGFPILQFCVFYIYVNFNSILLAFKNYDLFSGYDWVGIDNFKEVFYQLKNNGILHNAIKNTLLIFGIGIAVGAMLPVLVSYYIYKGRFGSGFFKILLFLPSVISALALVLAYKFFVEEAVPDLWLKLFGERIQGLLSNKDTRFLFILIFAYSFNMGASFLLYISTMSGISDSVVESAKIDGVSPFREFISITLPMIYPTFTTFIVVSVGTMLINQISLYSIYGGLAPERLYTIGYYIYMKTSSATITEYPYLAAFGLVCTAVSIPLTLVVKYCMERFGPSADSNKQIVIKG